MNETWHEKALREHKEYWITEQKLNSNSNPCLEIFLGTGGEECVLPYPVFWEDLFYQPNKLLLIC